MKKLNKNRALCLLSDICILIILFSMITTGNNWNSIKVKRYFTYNIPKLLLKIVSPNTFTKNKVLAFSNDFMS